jgi:O-acetyl-ADP-ribose deacetylase (regulator of RNase III)
VQEQATTRDVEGTRIELVKGDITAQETDAVVNAANSGLRGGGGVDGAIHRAGGPTIMEECRQMGSCPTGGAVITTGGELPADHVIHAVGPRWQGGQRGEEQLLAGAYSSSLQIAMDEGLQSVAFPSISTGAYGYPAEEAARVALNAIIEFLRQNPGELELVRLVLFSRKDLQTYREALEELLAE